MLLKRKKQSPQSEPAPAPQAGLPEDWAEDAGIAGGWDAIDWQSPGAEPERIELVDENGRPLADFFYQGPAGSIH